MYSFHPRSQKKEHRDHDQLQDHIVMLFKITVLHRNLDSAVDLADGKRSVRSAMFEMPIYNKTNKVKYLIGSIHLTALTSGILTDEQQQRLVSNRVVNIQGGKYNNIALDEYLEMLNRDSKVACSGYQTKESIILHSKAYPNLINFVKHFDEISCIRERKGFHHLPSYQTDVEKVLKDLMENNVLVYNPQRKLHCQKLSTDRNPHSNSFFRLSSMIHRHRTNLPFGRLRNPHL